MPVGVITHLHNVNFSELRALAQAAESAGADWLGIPDAFWWRDSWMLLAEAARVTERVELGPMVTNPYLRHPFHTLAAVASLQDLAGPRVFLGLAAGGSEVSGAAGVSRRDAPERLRELAALLRSVAGGEALDPGSGRRLEVPLREAPILIAGRGDGILRAAGRVADRALLWAVPVSELSRSVAQIQTGVERGRDAPSERPRVRNIAAYSVLNSRAEVQARWGLAPADVAKLRELLVGGGARAAADLVPAAALEDLIISDPDPARVGGIALDIGATSLALPAFSIEELPERVSWARQVLAHALSS